jgi:hypothetical protein
VEDCSNVGKVAELSEYVEMYKKSGLKRLAELL